MTPDHSPEAGAAEPSWYWRNCRSLGLKLDLWIWPWAFGTYRDDDVYGGQRGLHVGPLGIGVVYSIGSVSSYGLDRFTGLSEIEAFDRAERYAALALTSREVSRG